MITRSLSGTAPALRAQVAAGSDAALNVCDCAAECLSPGGQRAVGDLDAESSYSR